MAQAAGRRGGASVGSSPVEKTAIFGLRTLLTRPVRHGLPAVGLGAGVGRGRGGPAVLPQGLPAQEHQIAGAQEPDDQVGRG